jgi:hypothetical protein
MAESFGIVAGIIGIVSTFIVCIDYFEYIQFGYCHGSETLTKLQP